MRNFLHSLYIAWYVYPPILALGALVVTWLFQLPPKLQHMRPADLAVSAEYYNRINRKGTFTPRNLAHVVDWRVQEKA